MEVIRMVAKAYVLIETEGGQSKGIIELLSKMKGVKSVDIVTGPYDVIAVVEEESLNEVGDLITGKIHPINGVSRTVTCLSIKPA
jgi:DNA-binding Lrp family transcriptional regulator